MLNPTHLRTLREVLVTGSFAGAAGRLGYTPSAVSQQVAALERASGVMLFERSGRSIRPTHAAHAIAGRTRSVLRSLEALEREFRALSTSDGGVVCLGAFPTASASIVPDALAHLRGSRPEVSVQLTEAEPEDLVPAVEAGELDVAVVHRYDGAPRRWTPALTEVPLLDEALFLLTPASGEHAGAQRSLAALRDAPWIATREDTAGERCLLQLCGDAGFAPRIAYRSNADDVVRGMVRAGLGVAIAPALAGGREAGIRLVPLPDDAPRRTVLALARPVDANGLAMAMIWSLLQGAAACTAPGVRVAR